MEKCLTEEPEIFVDFRRIVADWYVQNKRDLPWRNTQNPYLIWISEVILQQTQVAQGLDYYRRFVARFPDVQTLAAASQDEVLKLWQGLGYYSRARNLHQSAQQIMTDFGGKFPEIYDQVRSLRGVGDYTAAAISSFAFRLPYATVDGNVYRVLSRYFGIDLPIDSTEGKKEFARLAQNLLDKNHPDIHNQALMEFGALQCTPSAPDCAHCPLMASCAAFAEKRVEQLPQKQGKTRVRERYFYYLFLQIDGKTYLRQRGAHDVWQGLYEFPLVELSEACATEQLFANEQFLKFVGNSDFALDFVSPVKKHVLSHQRIFAQCLVLKCQQKMPILNDFVEIPIENLPDFPVSRLMEWLIDCVNRY